jgi:imidazolonepropionase-like amidohydrolase
MRKSCLIAALAMLSFSVAAASKSKNSEPSATPANDPYPSTYQRIGSAPVLIRNATVLTGTGERLDNSDVLMRDGKIVGVGKNLDASGDATVVDGSGKWVTPGIIDDHSHLGVYPSPGVSAHEDGNELTNPTTPNVWAEHSIWPQDQGFATALAGGVTSLLVLPGSGNLIGGRGVVLKNVYANSYQAMKFPGAPHSVKMACGENPKRVYGSKGASPSTRMGNVAGYRSAFIEAKGYMKSWDKYNAGGKEKGDEPTQDLRLETLAGVMRGSIQVQIHCYRADEMMLMIDLAKEFNFKIASFHHAVEAYKIAQPLADGGICASMWADWWGFKMEALDGIQENIAMVDRKKNSCAIVHSDSAEGIQRLNQEAAKVISRSSVLGMNGSPENAMRWLSINPAKAMGIDKFTGSLEAGKMADVVLWSGTPFSVYAKAEKVYIDGALMFDINNKNLQPTSDFMVGQGANP